MTDELQIIDGEARGTLTVRTKDGDVTIHDMDAEYATAVLGELKADPPPAFLSGEFKITTPKRG